MLTTFERCHMPKFGSCHVSNYRMPK